jgi:hypothetical protein
MRVVFVALLVGVMGAATGGIARAYWGGSGSGAGGATTAATVPLTLGSGVPNADLYPGGQGNVVLTISNPNSGPVHVGSLALDTTSGTAGFGVDGAHSGCATSALTFTAQTNTGVGWTVPAKSGAVNGTLSITLTNAVAMDIGAANACQGAVFAVYLRTGP